MKNGLGHIKYELWRVDTLIDQFAVPKKQWDN